MIQKRYTWELDQAARGAPKAHNAPDLTIEEVIFLAQRRDINASPDGVQHTLAGASNKRSWVLRRSLERKIHRDSLSVELPEGSVCRRSECSLPRDKPNLAIICAFHDHVYIGPVLDVTTTVQAGWHCFEVEHDTYAAFLGMDMS